MYYSLEPPYFLLVAGLLAALTSGSAFAATLKQVVRKWSSDRNGAATAEGGMNPVARLSTQRLLLPFLGIAGGVCLFLAAGLEIFGFPTSLSYGVAVPITILISSLIWFQLGSMMAYVEQRGFQALDLDSFS